MGDSRCSINALSVTTTTITISLRGVAAFCKYKCPWGRYSDYVSVCKDFSPNVSEQSLEGIMFLIVWVREGREGFQAERTVVTVTGCRERLWEALST